MKILFHLGHPAHFHLFKNVIFKLREKGNQILVVIKKKDVLEDLLKSSDIEYINILPEGRKDGKLHVAIGQLKQDLMLWKVCNKFKPDILVGTSVAISHVGKLKGIPSINVNEDDAEIVPLYAKLAYPWATKIVAPKVCSVGKWKSKKIPYQGYHELAYLHPNNFVPSEEIASKYVDIKEKYFIIRFAKLTAHHDDGVKGINSKIASKIIEILAVHGKVYITSERQLESEFEKYRIQIDPKDMHHVMSFAHLYIGDSQTMAAEAGVLGVPFIRYNDFVGRISYLKELEEKYKLGFGILPSEESKLYDTLVHLLEMENLKEIFENRRNKMLEESIDLAEFLTNLLENYPLKNKQ
jgi:predicted glycosyltransferase